MKIVVCVKQVPEPGDMEVNAQGEIVPSTGATMMNLFDTFAIEEALRMKESVGAEVTAVSLADTEDVNVIKEAISYGLDDGVLIYDPQFAQTGVKGAGILLAKAIDKLNGVQLILTGMQTTDCGSGILGGMLAHTLNIPWFTNVKNIKLMDESHVQLEIGWNNGTQVIEASCPLVLSVSREINEPRMRTVKGMMKAKKAKIPVWDAKELGLNEDDLSYLQQKFSEVVALKSPPPKTKGQILAGSVDEQVEKLVEVYYNKSV